MPYKQIINGIYWEAVHHPKPAYPLHILILPKTPITSFVQAPKNFDDFYPDLFNTIEQLIEMFDLDQYSYRLITNGGPNQSFPQWHWHLISETQPS